MCSEQDEIIRLRREIEYHAQLYYSAQPCPEISDTTYDMLVKRLEQLEEAHPECYDPASPTQRVGGVILKGLKTVVHRVPMLSIQNAYTETQLRKFISDALKSVPDEKVSWVVELKIDGVAASVIYEHGVLTQAVTRGDGEKGNDITHCVRTIRDVPLRLHGDDYPDYLEIRGEIYMTNAGLEQLNQRLAQSWKEGLNSRIRKRLELEFKTLDYSEKRVNTLEREERELKQRQKRLDMLVRYQQGRGKELLANPRNATSGSIIQRDPRECAMRPLRMFCHSVGDTEGLPSRTHEEFLSSVRRWGLVPTPHAAAFPDFEQAFQYAQKMSDEIFMLPFEVDGIVFKVNRFTQREQIGSTPKYPKWIVAWKWEKYEAQTVLREITLQIGKTGVITPVAQLEPVQLAGTQVKRSTLHNFDEIARKDIRPGDYVVVEKAGKIIPHIVRVEKHLRSEDIAPFPIPEQCPVCGAHVCSDSSEDGVFIYCGNAQCPAQVKARVLYYGSRSGMDIKGLGDVLVGKLVDAGYVHSPADLYQLEARYDAGELRDIFPQQVGKNSKKVESTPRIQPRESQVFMFTDPAEDGVELEANKGSEEGDRVRPQEVENLIQAIRHSKSRGLGRLLAALSIQHLGTEMADILGEHFRSMEALRRATEEELSSVPGIGPKIASSVKRYLVDNEQLLSELREAGVSMEMPESQHILSVDEKSLSGQVVVLTGNLVHFTRQEMTELIKRLGGKTSSSVSSRTAFVLMGDKPGKKKEDAEKLGVPILTEDEFTQQYLREFHETNLIED